jgi:hypothetical protein
MTSRAQRKPKTTVMIAPAMTAGGLTTRPTRTQAMPTANPIGQMLGGG